MFLKRFVLAAAILLFSFSIAFSWEVEQGSRGNELFLEVDNSSNQPLPEVSVEVVQAPSWVHFETREITVADVLGLRETQKVRFLFDVSEDISPETEGRIELLVKGSERTWGKEVALTVVPATFLPRVTTLHQSSPNPFQGSAVIRYQLAERARTTLKVYNLAGRLVKTLVNEERPGGFYEAEWGGEDETGNILPSGTYFYCLNAGGFISTRKLIVLK